MLVYNVGLYGLKALQVKTVFAWVPDDSVVKTSVMKYIVHDLEAMGSNRS